MMGGVSVGREVVMVQGGGSVRGDGGGRVLLMVWGMRGRKVVMPQRSGEGREVIVKTQGSWEWEVVVATPAAWRREEGGIDLVQKMV